MASQITTDDRLDGWEAISDYLGWHVRTVIRWEKQKGLPVHRVPGGKRQPVYAYRHEIDLWFQEAAGAEPRATSALIELDREPSESPIAVLPARRSSQLAIWGTVTLTILLIASLTIAWQSHVQAAIQITGITQLTDDGTAKRNLVTDGKQLYFDEYIDGEVVLSTLAVDGGLIRRMNVPLPNLNPVAVSPNGNLLLVLSFGGYEEEHPLWVVPTGSGLPSLIAAKCRAAAWSPNGDWIAYGSSNAIYLSSPEGLHSHQLSKVDGIPQAIHWAADGKHLLLLLRSLPTNTDSLWQVDLDDNLNVRSVVALSTNGEKFGRSELLTGDANAYFTITNESPPDHVLYLRRGSWWRTRLFQASALATHLGAIRGLAADPDSHRLFVLSSSQLEGELVRYDRSSQSFKLLLPGVSATFVDLTKDMAFATYIKLKDSTLWVSRSDGSGAKQLSPTGMEVELPRWSPNGEWIAFMGRLKNRPWRIFIVPASGGVLKEASKGDDNQGAPTWSKDGHSLAYGNVYCQEMASCAVHTIDLGSGKTSLIPGSQGLTTARWSPDGLHIAALNSGRRELYVFDLGRGKWRRLADAINGNDVSWSSDSKFVYSKKSMNGQTNILRVAVGGGAVQSVLNLDTFSRSPGQLDTWFSLTPDNSLILNRRLDTSEIYALNYEVR
jgi:Tol biopolymer transport system component